MKNLKAAILALSCFALAAMSFGQASPINGIPAHYVLGNCTDSVGGTAYCAITQAMLPAGLAGSPSGTAGGDLAGTYPNPTIKASVSLTTPVLGVATGTSLAATSFLKGLDLQLVGGVAPTCNAGARGTFWYAPGATSVADVVEVCAKNSSDVYGWISVATIP